MGNRAVIAFKGCPVGIYLHWNGGRDSIQAFLAYAKEIGVRDPIVDPSYALAQVTRIIGNYFEHTLSLGVNTLDKLDCDNGDNGVYVVGKDWKIVGRKHFRGEEQNSHPLEAMMTQIREKNMSLKTALLE